MRPTKDENFMEIAKVIAKRSTCKRRKVGCVITDVNGYILSTGYNGVPKKVHHCEELYCGSIKHESGKNLDTCAALHAEQNAIARLRESLEAHTMYSTTEPCVSCLKLILATGIKRVVFAERYNNSSELITLSKLRWEHV